MVAKATMGGSCYRKLVELFPGLMVAVLIALAATFMSEHYGGPTLVYALFFGMAFHFLAEDQKTHPGIELAATTVLRLGVALLGARIMFTEMALLGWQLLAMVAIAVILTLLLGSWFGSKLLKLPLLSPQGVIGAGAVSICGASAALAIAAVAPSRNKKEVEHFTLLVVVGVTSLSTLAMILYPLLAALLGLSQLETGVFLGGSIHDVAQVVGAGYIVSDQTGDLATVVKLFRVAMLLPVVVVLAFLFGKRAADHEPKRPPLVPFFLLGFIFFAGLNSQQLLPGVVVDTLVRLSQWCLVVAIAALGVKTSFKKLLALGWRPLALLLCNTLLIALLILGGLLIISRMH